MMGVDKNSRETGEGWDKSGGYMLCTYLYGQKQV